MSDLSSPNTAKRLQFYSMLFRVSLSSNVWNDDTPTLVHKKHSIRLGVGPVDKAIPGFLTNKNNSHKAWLREVT